MTGSPTSSRPGLAVTLVGGSLGTTSARVARLLSGAPAASAVREVDRPGTDSAEFADELAADLVAAWEDGVRGDVVIALEPEADVTELALVLEFVLESHRPSVPVVVRDVVAVTSVHEVMSTLLGSSGTDGPGDDVNLPGHLARRLEFASIVLLTDVSWSAAPAGTRHVTDLLSHLAPGAAVVSEDTLLTVRSPTAPLRRGRAHRLGASMGWQQRLAGRSPSSQSRRGISAHVFRDPRPFHPGRLMDAVAHALVPDQVGRIARSRGFTRLATRPAVVGSWASAGEVLDLDPTAVPSWDVDAPAGQEIVFFGLDLDGAALDAALGSCLLTPSELLAGPMSWGTYADPFPEWPAAHHHH
jgi:G3E family GTPase